MFTDDTVLLGDSEEKLNRLVQEFGSVCQRRKLTVNESKIKIMRIGKNGEANEVNVSMNDRRMEEVETYRYLGVDMSSEGAMEEEANHRITEERRVWGSLKDVWKKRHISNGPKGKI